MTYTKEQVAKRVDTILQAARNAKPKIYQVEEVQLYSGYAEPGYSDPESGLVATGNWNRITKYHPDKNEFETVDETMPRIAKLFEKLGVELEWSDEWTSCEDCGLLFRTSPDSYGWKKAGIDEESGTLCCECLAKDPAEYLESLEGDSNRCMTIDSIDLDEQGYVKVNEDSFEHGFHPGQDADPKKIGKALRDIGITRFIFTLDSTGQFDMDFSVWVHESEKDKLEAAQRALSVRSNTDGPSVSAALSNQLKSGKTVEISREEFAEHDLNIQRLDEFTRAYIECALWSTNDESDEQGGDPLDENYTIQDLSPACLKKMTDDCAKFQRAHAAELVDENYLHVNKFSALEIGGHDFWLTRNGHGAGFWDGDWKKDVGEALTAASKKYGEVNLYVGDDGKIHHS
jgi:hypothetical protein